MSSNAIRSLDSLVHIKGGKRLPAGRSLQTVPNSHPYIRVRDLGSRSLPRLGLEYVPDEIFPSISRYIVNKNDLVLSIVGTIGALSIVDEYYEKASLTENCVRLNGLNAEDALYLYYYLLSDKGQEEIRKGTVGAVQPKLPIYNIEKINVIWPNPNERKTIASTLGELDDRITLLRETNTTLEAIAQALFKSWFVDFDPVRAKSEGRLPEGMHETTAALFPDAFEVTELGEVPRGWSQHSIASLCNIVTRGVTPVYGVGSNLFVINQKVNRGSELDLSALKELARELAVPQEKMAHKWDLLVNCLGEGTLGRVHLFTGKTNIYAIDQHMSICRGSPSVNVFLSHILSSKVGQQKIQDLKTGSTGMTMLNISKLREFLALWPGQELADKFFETVVELYESVSNNFEQIKALQDTRNALLPRLISGKLRIADAEAELEKVTA